MPRRRVSFATIAVTGLGAFVAAAVGVTLYVSASQSWRFITAIERGETRSASSRA